MIFPDPRLRQAATAASTFDDALRAHAGDLADTLGAVSAIGLAGPHVGLALRVVALRLEPGHPVSVYVNPVIAWASAERASHVEGSVSMPGVTEAVERAARIRVRFADLDGVEREEEAEGFRAACLQHEIDQLHGIFWIDRLSRLKRERACKRFLKMRASGV